MLSERERQFLANCRVAHLATADRHAVPHVVPVCFAVRGNTLSQFLTHGILAAPGADDNLLVGNTVTAATQEDCRDLASGNAWTDNVGADSDPVGICVPI